MRFLIVLRCGRSSIHRSWIESSRALWDVAFVHYDDSDFSSDHPTHSAMIPGTKLTGINEFFRRFPEMLDQYDYFWLVEDDLFLPQETISGMVDFLSAIRPALCAPALTFESFYTHPIMIQCDSLFARGTDFVECMAPVMSRDFLSRSLDQFLAYPIYGIERYWQKLLWDLREVAYILDCLPIAHTRPVGSGSLYGLERQMGIDKFRDDLDAAEKFGRPFERDRNVLFGVRNAGLASLVVGAELKDCLVAGATRFLRAAAANRQALATVLAHTGFANRFFSTCLTFESVRRLLYLGDVTEIESELMVRDWTFGNAVDTYTDCMKLSPDGRIRGYVNNNEYRWRIDGESLLFLARAGHVTTSFARSAIEGGRLTFEGAYAHSEGARHRLRET